MHVCFAERVLCGTAVARRSTLTIRILVGPHPRRPIQVVPKVWELSRDAFSLQVKLVTEPARRFRCAGGKVVQCLHGREGKDFSVFVRIHSSLGKRSSAGYVQVPGVFEQPARLARLQRIQIYIPTSSMEKFNTCREHLYKIEDAKLMLSAVPLQQCFYSAHPWDSQLYQ